MASPRLGIVWNPSKAARSDLETALDRAVEDASVPVTAVWAETSADDPGATAVDEVVAAGADVVAAVGGDGTVRAVAERLAADDDGPDLAIVPLGTGNLLARNLGVPLGDPAAAFARALTGRPRPVDLGWLEAEIDGRPGRHAFAVMAGFGVDAHMITETNEDLKARAGWLAYVESLGRALTASGVIRVVIGIDGRKPRQIDAHTVIVGNCGAVQGGLALLPDADPSDGVLDLIALDAEGVGGWLGALRNLTWDNGVMRLFPGEGGPARDGAGIAHRRLTTVRMELSRPRVVEVDGDDLGETDRIEIRTQPGAVRVR